MPDTPIADALKDLAKNQVLLEGKATQHDGNEAHLTVEREKGHASGGVDASISDAKGWSVSGFFKWIWGGTE